MGWWIFGAFCLWFFFQLRKGFKRLDEAKRRGDMVSYSAGSVAKNWMLALAHPMAYHSMRGGFAESHLSSVDDTLAKDLRPMILHHLGMRTDLSDDSIRQQLPDQLRQKWFSLDLLKLHRSDQPRAAMAFACARVAFFVRSAFLMGWIDDATQWQLLQLNGLRTQECFNSWQDYGEAYAQGRAQWVAQGRSDILGTPFTPEQVAEWVNAPQHPWHVLAWDTALQEASESESHRTMTAPLAG